MTKKIEKIVSCVDGLLSYNCKTQKTHILYSNEMMFKNERLALAKSYIH